MWVKGRFKQVVLVLVLSLPQGAFGWGSKGHQIVAQLGARLAVTGHSFWSANENNMAMLTVVPDKYWKPLSTGSIERPTHYFEPDGYVSSQSQFSLIPHNYQILVANYGQDFVTKHGTSIWRVYQFYKLGVDALKRGDFKTGLEMAGVMSHYIADMSQPLHVTTNYDGQETGQYGIHAFYESTNIQNGNTSVITAAVIQEAQALLKNQSFLASFNGPVIDVMFAEVDRAYSYKDELLLIDKQFGRKGVGAQMQLDHAKLRMADGVATLSLILSRMWKEAGYPSGGATVFVSPPDWVAPNYAKKKLASFDMLEDDCN